MTYVDSYAAGMPCWVDVACHDAAAGKDFYTELFGWDSVDDEDGFATFNLDGRPVAGLGPCQAGTRPSWNVYVAVSSVDAAVTAVKGAGGTVLAGPGDILNLGRGAACTDPQGGVFTLWQARDHLGARVTRVPGTWYWSDLVTPDIPRAAAFYTAVFGWAVRGADPSGSTGAVAMLGQQGVAGFSPLPAGAAPGPYWSVTFQVADVDGTAEQAGKLGATVAVAPMDVPNVGRFAAIAAPGRETFSILRPFG
ncbi:VOC family protein [Sporichthya sp.]|uniref:VOC family protein n=1 Tax=Sporichthya sp. TaxID=65475 RepID=UPI00184387B0|nr:VOC family protein [Sporichthya sp.]MBA3745700.1 VOC family protein [Sporichthya sp.]